MDASNSEGILLNGSQWISEFPVSTGELGEGKTDSEQHACVCGERGRGPGGRRRWGVRRGTWEMGTRHTMEQVQADGAHQAARWTVSGLPHFV